MSKRSFGSHIAELAIVIIGVTVAFWISIKADQKKEREVLDNYYSELIEEIESDLRDLELAVRLNTEKQEKLARAIQFYNEPLEFQDSIVKQPFWSEVIISLKLKTSPINPSSPAEI